MRIIEHCNEFRIAHEDNLKWEECGSVLELCQYFPFEEEEMINFLEQNDCHVQYYDFTNSKWTTRREYVKHLKNYNGDKWFICPFITFDNKSVAEKVLRMLEEIK